MEKKNNYYHNIFYTGDSDAKLRTGNYQIHFRLHSKITKSFGCFCLKITKRGGENKVNKMGKLSANKDRLFGLAIAVREVQAYYTGSLLSQQ